MKTKLITSIFALLLYLCLTTPVTTFGQTYSSDLDDISGILHPITPIGDLGDIQTVIDLRGFIPFSADSNKIANTFWHWDVHQWYQLPMMGNPTDTGVTSRLDILGHVIPLSAGIAYLYYGNYDDTTKIKFLTTKLLKEDQLQGEDLQWAKFAFGLVSPSGEDLFTSANGSSWNFEGAEPVAVLLTAQSAIVIINFRYWDVNRTGKTGQILCGYEFSRTLKTYKNYYDIYRTTLFNGTIESAFSKSAPYIARALLIYFSGK